VPQVRSLNLGFLTLPCTSLITAKHVTVIPPACRRQERSKPTLFPLLRSCEGVGSRSRGISPPLFYHSLSTPNPRTAFDC
jgi:hypothetical protein